MNAPVERPRVLHCEGDQLVGIVHPAADPKGPYGVVVIVGGPQYRAGSHRQFTLMSRQLAAAGIQVLRYDIRGMGDSTGEAVGFASAKSDVQAGVNALMDDNPALDGAILWGLCDGASAILMHGADDPRVRGVVLVNPWVQTESREAESYLRHYYGRRLLQRAFWTKLLTLQMDVLASLKDGFRKLALARTQGDDAPFVRQMLAGIEGFRKPVLILLSEHDLVARQFAELCRRNAAWRRAVTGGNVTVRNIAGSDHTFSSRMILDAVSRDCANWIASLGSQPCH